MRLMKVRNLSARIAKQAPDGVFLALVPPSSSELAKQLRANGFKGELFGMMPLRRIDEVQRAQGALERAWMSAFDDRNVKDVLDKISKRMGGPATPDGVVGYDVARLLLVASKQSLPWEQYLSNLTVFEGKLGTAKKEQGSNSFKLNLILKEVRDGTFKEIMMKHDM